MITNDLVPVTFTVTLAQDDAAQLAQFCKRVTFTLCRAMTEPHLPAAERERRAWQMMSGVEAIRSELCEQGFAPR